jgi:signal transduction histidine kinase/ligand-binding sensor domain-containing protein
LIDKLKFLANAKTLVILFLVKKVKKPFMTKRLSVLLFVLIWQLFISFTVHAERLPIKIYTSADGLGSSFITDLYRDSRGFMWFCTRDGLSRFDGAQLVNYQIGEKNSPPTVENIFETRSGKYLISTTGGTYLFNPDLLTAPKTAVPRLEAERITDIRGQLLEDDRGNVWLGSNEIYRLIEENGKISFQKVDWGIPPQSNEFLVNSVDKTPDGSIWFYTSWGLVRRLPDERIVVYTTDSSMHESGSSFPVFADKNGNIWFAVTNEVYLMKPESIESLTDAAKVTVKPLKPTSIFEIKPEENVPMPTKSGEIFQYKNPFIISSFISRRFFQTSDGDIWITAQNTLLQIENGVLHVHTDAKGLPHIMGAMEEDSAGNLWIGGRNGLARFNRGGMITYGVLDGAASLSFLAITEGKDGSLYFGNEIKNINRFDGKNLQTVSLDVPSDWIHTWMSRFLMIDSSGDFWFLSNKNLARFSAVDNFAELNGKQPTKIYSTDDGLKAGRLFQIFEDSKGNIWVSTRGEKVELNGLSRLGKGEETFQTFSEAEGFPPKVTASAFAEDKNGNIWIGFYEGGLVRYNGERFETVSDKKEFPAVGLISDLHLDKKGYLWFSTSNSGLFRIENPGAENLTYISFTTENGLTSNNIRTITEDHLGRIYAGTANGVDRLTPETGRIKHFGISDGLAADFVVDSHCDREGNLWFATGYGLSRLLPLPDEKTLPPQIFIGGLRIAGEPQAISELGNTTIETSELYHTQNNLQIDFFGLDFRAGETLRYQYKFEKDADWSAPNEQRSINFANLSPDTYRFLIRAVNSEGVASEKPAVISFRILPPIYLRWWFIALSVLAISVIIYALYRNRLARLETARLSEENLRKAKEERLAELEKVRSRIATDLHDDIGASLTQIAILSEVAQAQSKANGASEPLKMIYDVSNELVGTMSDIVWAINPNKDHLHDLTLRMRRFASDVLTAKEIDFEFETPANEKEILLNSNLRREVFLIFKEAINNIIKHSEATEVQIDFEISENNLSLKIADNGIGFENEKISENSSANLFADYKGGNGLLSIKRRANELGGNLEIISEIKKGTQIKLNLPLQIIEKTKLSTDKHR